VVIDDPQHWRDRAIEIRATANLINDPVVRNMLLKIADDYGRLAERAEERQKRK